jgi:Na+-translocating ferredoxin:NAD+ oxidoreductase RnfC subunit
MIPSDRWQSVLGVKKFDRLATFIGEKLDFNKVEINLRQHIGAPSVPVVKTGDRVVKGQIIANANEGLSLPQHASIDGVVTVYENQKIVIENK